MDSKEVQLVINEILTVLEETALDKYSVIGAKKEDSEDYSIRVKGFLGAVRKQQVYEIAKKHGLHAQEDLDCFILYE